MKCTCSGEAIGAGACPTWLLPVWTVGALAAIGSLSLSFSMTVVVEGSLLSLLKHGNVFIIISFTIVRLKVRSKQGCNPTFINLLHGIDKRKG